MQRWQTIPEMVLSAGDRFGAAEAVADGPLRFSFAELAERVRCAAGAFAAAGIEKGDRAAIWAPNSAEWIIAAFGLLTAGGVLVPVNTRFKAAEADDVIRRSGSKLVLVEKGFLGLDFTVPPGVPVIDLKSDFLASGSPLYRPVDGTAIADIIFTSGTTGRPKGVMMNHLQNLRGYADWCDLADLREGDRYLIVNPFFHTFGYKAGCIASCIRGATMLPVRVFDVAAVLELIEAERITMLPGPPTLYHSLLAAQGEHDLSSLRAAVTGSADIPVELIRRIRNELPFQSIMTGYGLTEAGTVTASRRGDSFEDIATTVGRVCDDLQVRIDGGAEAGGSARLAGGEAKLEPPHQSGGSARLAGGEAKLEPPHQSGELLVRGYSVMQGYLDDPAATAAAIDPDGWLHTGDLASIDDAGRVRIVGRMKDMFIVGGFNAYPAEIEGFLLEHPAVRQAAVIGVPDERLGQVGKAFVVAESPVSEQDLIAWSRERMAGFKVPRSVQFVADLPLNATGKVDKAQLR